MSLQTYLNAIRKIETDPLSFLFCSHAEKRVRQLEKFFKAFEKKLEGTLTEPEIDTAIGELIIRGEELIKQHR